MNKVNKQSLNIQEEKLIALKSILPNLFNEDGTLDVKELELWSKIYPSTTSGKYEFNWAGKMSAKRNAYKPSKAALKPDIARSLDFDNTENMIIEGDNLEVLKLLQKSYSNKIKCIYIDPPYNTGKDKFIYTDDFSEEKKSYWETNGTTNNGIKIDTNAETQGRYHSNWLNMIYPRLLLSLTLLTPNGLIFVSIDDHEVHNLRKIMDDIFGEENFVTTIMWKRKKEKSNDVKGFSVQGEYIVVYSKSSEYNATKLPLSDKYVTSAYQKDAEGNLWRPVPITVDIGHKGGGYEYTIKTPSGKEHTRIWRMPKTTFDDLNEKGLIYYGVKNDAIPQRVKYIDDSSGTFPSNYWDDLASNKEGKKELLELFGFEAFDTVKPTALIKKILTLVDDNSIILDFFAGSGTTAQAVFEQNDIDEGNRQFILVQIPELIDEKEVAYKNGFKTISEVCIERIKRVTKNLDKKGNKLGFKVFKLAASLFPENQFTPDPEKSEEQNIEALNEYLKKVKSQLKFEFNEIELLYEVLLKDGFNLNFKTEQLSEIKANKIFKVTDNEKEALVCLDDTIDNSTLKILEDMKEHRFICLERAVDTTKKWNLKSIFGKNLWVI